MDLLVRFPDARVSHPATLAEGAMECQATLRDLRVRGERMWQAARASRNWSVVSEAAALHETITTAERMAHRLAGYAEEGCPDGAAGMGHGKAS